MIRAPYAVRLTVQMINVEIKSSPLGLPGPQKACLASHGSFPTQLRKSHMIRGLCCVDAKELGDKQCCVMRTENIRQLVTVCPCKIFNYPYLLQG